MCMCYVPGAKDTNAPNSSSSSDEQMNDIIAEYYSLVVYNRIDCEWLDVCLFVCVNACIRSTSRCEKRHV